MLFAALGLCFFAIAANTAAQDLSVKITVDASRPNIARIEGRFLKARGVPNLSFLPSYAGINGLGERFSDVKLADDEKKAVEFKRLQPGDYVAESNFTWFTYAVDLTPRKNASAAAHVSWLSTESGMLVMDDLLPQPTDKLNVRLTLELPAGWRMLSTDDRPAEQILNIADAQRSVVFVGRNWRVRPVGNTQMRLAIAGEWQFTDDAAANAAAAIYESYKKAFGPPPSGPAAQIVLTKFPTEVGLANWEAETRGSTVVIVASDASFASQAGPRLYQQLRHEIFHLWVPNGVELRGNYDWFYEGFAIYEAEKLGVSMNQVRFQDFLATLSRAYDMDRLTTPRRSLVDISANRWAGSNTQVYARGVLIAFLCDLAMLDASKGKRSADVLLRELFERHRPPAARANANETITALMRSNNELVPIVDRYIKGSDAVDWAPLLQKAGLVATARGSFTELAAVERPSGRQKDLLDKLGYNSWRKLIAFDR
jgi:predicted metalloprotease with PDZ domain